jgi:CRP-like cAMP-binding protein
MRGYRAQFARNLLLRGRDLRRLYILAEQRRGAARYSGRHHRRAGAVFGEMSALLEPPAYGNRQAMSPVAVFVFDDAESFLKSNPEIAFLLGRLLAERLNAATTYLVDLKRQFEGHGNHLGMVGEVLESLIHQQHEEFTPGPEREADPRL